MQITWRKIGEVPKITNYENADGVNSFLYGVIDKKIIIAGGANFPNDLTPDKGGSRVIHKDIYLLEIKNNNFKVLEQKTLPYSLANCASFSYEDAIYCVATINNTGKILKITLANYKTKIEELFTLDFKFQNGFCVVKNKKLYFGLGSFDGENTNDIYVFDLTLKTLEHFLKVDCTKRNNCVVSLLGDELFIFGGASNVVYTDALKINILDKTQTKISDIEIDNEKISVLGGASVNLDNDEIFILGGFNKEIFDFAVKNLTTLKDEELLNFKKQYFSKDISYFKWHKNPLIYNKKTNSFRALEEVPFNSPCGAGTLKIDNEIFVIMGEVKPGKRTPNVYQGVIK